LFVNKDIIKAQKALTKLIKTYVVGLYSMWILRCNIVHIKIAKEVAIEKLNDLRSELSDLIHDNEFR